MVEVKIQGENVQTVTVKSGDVLIIRGIHQADFFPAIETMKDKLAAKGIINLTFIGVPAGAPADVFELLDEEQMRQKGWVRVLEAEGRG